MLLIDSNEPIKLGGDGRKKIKSWQIPKADTAYRLKIRRVCRALLKTSLVDRDQFPHRIEPIEDVIGMPIISIIEKK